MADAFPHLQANIPRKQSRDSSVYPNPIWEVSDDGIGRRLIPRVRPIRMSFSAYMYLGYSGQKESGLMAAGV